MNRKEHNELPEEPETSQIVTLHCLSFSGLDVTREQAREGFKLSPVGFRSVSNDIVGEAGPNERFKEREREF